MAIPTYFQTNTIYCGDCLFVLKHDIPPQKTKSSPQFLKGK